MVGLKYTNIIVDKIIFQVAAQRTHALGEVEDPTKQGVVISVDLQGIIESFPTLRSIDLKISTTHKVKGDFMEESTRKEIKSLLKGKKADVVLSDMAPSASGARDIDHIMFVECAWITN